MGDEKKSLSDAVVRAVLNLHHGTKTKVRVRLEYLKNFLFNLVYARTPRICAVASNFHNHRRCNHEECKKRLAEGRFVCR